MTESTERTTTSWSAGRAVVIAGGALLTIVLFLPWYWTTTAGSAGHLTGLALSYEAPELGILPAIGLAAVVGGVATARLPRIVSSVEAAWAAVGVGLVGLFVTLEVTIRLSGTLSSLYGTSFGDAAGVGWYVAMLASFLILAAGGLRLAMPAERFAATTA